MMPHAQVFVILGAFFGSCWIHDDTMAGYASVCLMGSSIFITIQAMPDGRYFINDATCVTQLCRDVVVHADVE